MDTIESLREFSEVAPCVDWSEILEACEIVIDEHANAPWEDCDGWEHELVDDESSGEAAGYVYSSRHAQMVKLTNPEAWGNFEHFQSAGASKQVAFELTAWIQRKAKEQIAEWHNNGWTYYGVKCEMHGEHASVWGIDSEEYAREEVLPEIASEMAGLLAKAGFHVTGEPESTPQRKHLRIYSEMANKEFGGVNGQNWQGRVTKQSKAWRRWVARNPVKQLAIDAAKAFWRS
jgi:hypothetical protein